MSKEILLDNSDLSYVKKRYQNRIKDYGTTFKSMNSGDLNKQNRRHHNHSRWIRKNDTILDIGCGLGQFFIHLRKKKHLGDYTGYDIVPEYVEYCQSQWPKTRFLLRNLFEQGIDQKYDVIVASQVFNNNYKKSKNVDVIRQFLEEAFESCRRFVTIDFLSSYVDYTLPTMFYYQPEEVFKLGKKISRFVAVHHDYLPFEFTLQIFKDQNQTDLTSNES